MVNPKEFWAEVKAIKYIMWIYQYPAGNQKLKLPLWWHKLMNTVSSFSLYPSFIYLNASYFKAAMI